MFIDFALLGPRDTCAPETRRRVEKYKGTPIADDLLRRYWFSDFEETSRDEKSTHSLPAVGRKSMDAN